MKNIVFIVADDLGFNDVGFHGSTQIPTPNIDAIARGGVTLNDYHVQPVCSPTRSAIMSGRHVIHTGVYMAFAQGTSPRLPLNYTLLPAYLKKLGYATHIVGKWHLGQNVLAALPLARGFDTHFGYWSGAEGYYTHDSHGAYDLADGLRTAFEYNNTYSTYAWTEKAVKVIKNSNTAVPFFLYLAYQNVHWPLEAPQKYMDRFANATGGNKERQLVCAMVAIMDESIGHVVQALKEKGIYENTLLVFSTDNGGPANGNEGTQSNNWPLRGGKSTLWEGGTRGIAAVRGAGIRQPAGTVSYGKMHVADWLPTLLHAASGNAGWFEANVPAGEPPYLLGDGIDVWDMLSSGAESPRDEIVQECHPGGAHTGHGNSITVGRWKAVRAAMVPGMEAGWNVPPGEEGHCIASQIKCDPAGPPAHYSRRQCMDQYCLFDVDADPCEYHDLAARHPQIVHRLTTRLQAYQATAVAQVVAEGCDPVITNGAWRPCDSPDPSPSEELLV